jgi:hypothetical protein
MNPNPTRARIRAVKMGRGRARIAVWPGGFSEKLVSRLPMLIQVAQAKTRMPAAFREPGTEGKSVTMASTARNPAPW